ncbi:MAG: hypothetical protein ABL891_17645, partial [Burkholderiales bacterium]
VLCVLSAILLCVVQLSGCGKSKEREAAEAAAAKMAEAAKKMEEIAKSAKSGVPQSPQEAMKQGADAMAAASGMIGAMMGGDGKGAVEPVDFRVLKELLPETIGGLRRGEESGERAAAGGMKMSHAQARYGNGEKTRLRVKITDAGSMSGFAGMAGAAWAMIEIDRETDRGYEKTSTVDGRKMHEKWNTKDKRGEVDMIVGGRFIVEIRGTGIEMKDLKRAINAIDLKKLEALKSAPPAASAAK